MIEPCGGCVCQGACIFNIPHNMQSVFIKAAHFLAFDHNADDIVFGIDSQMRAGIADLGNGFFIAGGGWLF